MQLPNLTHVGGDLNAQGNQNVSEHSFPNLEVVQGDLNIANSGFQQLPPKLNQVDGRLILSKTSPASLVQAVMNMKEKGLIRRGVYYCD